jgi:hypothetical protein
MQGLERIKKMVFEGDSLEDYMLVEAVEMSEGANNGKKI